MYLPKLSMLSKNFAFVDIETTGHSAKHDRIIEIGVIRVENNRITKTFQSLIDPYTYLSPFIENLTGINHEMLTSAPTFREAAGQLDEILRDCIFVAHNARFDYGFIKNEFKRIGMPFSPPHFCTVKLSKLLYPTHAHHNLDSIIERFNIHIEQRHRAYNDALALSEFFQKLYAEHNESILQSAIEQAMKKPSLPQNLSESHIQSLPETPGVYIMYGSSHISLYIGKSVNIKKRVLSHFLRDYDSPLDMKLSQEVTSIEHVPTCGELGALFCESTLIKKLQPLYNRKLRESKQLVLIKKGTTSQGYSTVNIDSAHTITRDDIPDLLGVFKSKKQAKDYLLAVAKEYSLCEKFLKLDNAPRACFAYRLGWCKGACIGREKPLSYNMRFTQALSKRKIKPWPFPGPIIIQEQDNETEKSEGFIFNNWCLLGIVKHEEPEMQKQDEIVFDFDLYKILCQFLRYPKNYKYIRSLARDYNSMDSMESSSLILKQTSRENLY